MTVVLALAARGVDPAAAAPSRTIPQNAHTATATRTNPDILGPEHNAVTPKNALPGAGVEPASPTWGHPILSRARMTSFATPAGGRTLATRRD